MSDVPPTDTDIPPDPTDLAPDVTPTDESGGDKTARIAEEDGGVGSTVYTVQPGRKVVRDGVMLEAGTQLQFRADEIASGFPAALIAAGDIA